MLAVLAVALALAASTADDLRAAQQLAWNKQFDRAAAIYRRILRDEPSNVDARKGLATMEYWTGDFRSAQRDFDLVLRTRPDDTDSRRALIDIAAASAPVIESHDELTTDDQPMRRNVWLASYTQFTDPLTTWTATGGAYVLAAGNRATAPFAQLAVNSAIPSLHLRATAALRALRFPDDRTMPLGSLSISREWSHSSLTAGIERHELLYTKSSLHSHPNEFAGSVSWQQRDDHDSSAATLRIIHYFDHNDGRAFDAYHLRSLTPFLSIGASASYRDTDESRFDGARYDPYWTPRNLVETRAIAATTIHARRTTLSLHADAGWAHDHDQLSRTFHPWRLFADIAIPLRGTFNATAGVERQSTVFYRANTIRFGFSGRL